MFLTPSQTDVAVAYRNHAIRTGRSPTLAEIGDELGLTKVTIHEHVRGLIAKGVLKRKELARGFELVPGVKLPDENRGDKFPIVGTIE